MEIDENGLLTDRLTRMYPMVNQKQTPLPSWWNPQDKYQTIWLKECNLRVHYKGTSKVDKDAGSVRANNPIPTTCGIYYFEINIIDQGEQGYIGIGISSKNVNLNQLPGWDSDSYGYHGDDGNKYHLSGNGKPYGPKFTTGDIIGCGINFIDKTMFYTKNGKNLGVAFLDIPYLAKKFYPTIGFQTKDAIIETNFGQNDFLFNINFMKNDLENKVKQSIMNVQLWDNFKTYKIIISYLMYHGYIETALIFAKSTGLNIDEDIKSIRNRQIIINLVKDGNIEDALLLTDEIYPNLFQENKELQFKLICRQFIEMINSKSHELQNELQFMKQPESNYLQFNGDVNNQSTLKKLLTLGEKIYNYNKTLNGTEYHDNLTKLMLDTFSLLSYSDPHNSCMSSLLDGSHRKDLYYELNTAIMKYLGKPSISLLDLAPSLATDIIKYIAEVSNPLAVFVNVESFIKSED
ncbi:hypothetical protein O3M35_009148 [Rhynocoris fuscipes]|uniref:SPRY-domain-containing protein n=1 Tax=Rhynocoris fuscipes TaxID=488301 RepID=A0AAW1D9G0_9HEMI